MFKHRSSLGSIRTLKQEKSTESRSMFRLRLVSISWRSQHGMGVGKIEYIARGQD
jgi:hypothetical protein